MLQDLRAEIIRKFGTQSDFAAVMNVHESRISQIVRGRRKLSQEDAEKWRNALGCGSEFLEPVTKTEK